MGGNPLVEGAALVMEVARELDDYEEMDVVLTGTTSLPGHASKPRALASRAAVLSIASAYRNIASLGRISSTLVTRPIRPLGPQRDLCSFQSLQWSM